jgi:glycosyltransferase involved in cell wall biosynthesis
VLRLVMLTVFARAHVRRLTRFRPGSPWLREVNAPVTVLVPAYNEEAGIETTVRSLLASTHPYLEVIVIDDGSTDQTADLATWIDDPRVQVIRQPNPGKAAALNTGLAHAAYDIVVMVDADTVFETALNPFRAYPLLGAALNTLVVDKGMQLRTLVTLFQAMRGASLGGGRQLNVPVTGPGISTSKGDAVQWDEAKAKKLFAELREDRPVR